MFDKGQHADKNSPGIGKVRSVRFRLLAIALFPMFLVMPLLLGAMFLSWSSRFDDLLIAKVNGELTIAHQYMSRILETSGSEVQSLVDSAVFQKTLESQSETALLSFLDAERERLGFDFLYYITKDGRIRSSPRTSTSRDLEKWPVVSGALEGKQTTGIDIFEAEDLEFFEPGLAEQASLPLVPTEAAVPTGRTTENRGMVVHTASPVFSDAAPSALVAGVLLNRNLEFIDTINDLVYPAASLTEGSQGTATLFLEDVRVSTNVRLFENVRALGTRVSAIVRSTVLDKGEVWLDRAFVVNDWYISAYEPIVDSFGDRVGMLYVGFLDTPFQQAKRQTLLVTILVFLTVVLLSVPIFLRWARSIFKPLESVVGTIVKVEQGDLHARTSATSGGDEISRVAGHLDSLLDQLQERDQELRDWADVLNERVAERTRELRDANHHLEAATKQLVVSEKLAAIGEITAGIAHEINNPIAVIQGNLDVIRQEIGDESDHLETEFGLIYEQVHSVYVLVNKLLQFARPEEYAGHVEKSAPDAVIHDCIPLVQHLLNKVEIELRLDLNATRSVTMNRTELQQVLINLIVNAIHSMPDGGKLALITRDEDQGDISGITIVVADSGAGMKEKIVSRVFDPFFTTKRSEGTGLGLSISRQLINRSRGEIGVESAPGKGTTFTIWLPSESEN
ncbi:MAG: HAMP domain-containing protein [Rhodobacteraceae bacterium]|nr:HAMP domain-containing protein [Paracoccaceae bacterium]